MLLLTRFFSSSFLSFLLLSLLKKNAIAFLLCWLQRMFQLSRVSVFFCPLFRIASDRSGFLVLLCLFLYPS